MVNTTSLMMNGMQQFADANGVPYLAGKVYMEVPNTNTPKVNWVDMDHLAENTYPITLDAAGRCVIWGEGIYRQRLLDVNGVEIWDKLTSSDQADTAAPGPPDKSVQFNDGGDFGGSAFFLFDKVQGRVALGDLSAITSQVALFIKSNRDTNVYSDGENSKNSFIGYSSFGGASTFAASVEIYKSSHSVNIWSKGVTSFNRFEGSCQIDVELAVGGHSTFGNLFTDTKKTIKVKETVAGALASGTYYGVAFDSTYSNTGANSPGIIGLFSTPQLLNTSSGNFDSLQAIYGGANVDITGEILLVQGAQFDGIFSNGTGRVVQNINGINAGAYNSSSHVTALPVMSAIDTVVNCSGNQVVTNAYGIHIGVILGSFYTNAYGLRIEEQTAGGTRCYNIWSDNVSGNPLFGKNFFGSVIQLGSTGTGISEVSAGVVGIGTGAGGSIAGTISAAAYKVGGAPGVSGSFTTVDAKTVGVTNGIVTSIV